MEDLWKIRSMDYRIGDLAERAEYDRLRKRFHLDEERVNRNNLLYGDGNRKLRPIENGD